MAKNQIISVVFNGIEIGKMGYDENQRKSSFQFNQKEFPEALPRG